MFSKVKKIFTNSKKLKAEDEGDIPLGNYNLNRGDLDKVHKVTLEKDATKLYDHLNKNRCDLNRRDRRHRTPLHIACAAGHADAVQLLAVFKAEINLSDGSGNSALMKAVQGGHGNCVKILLEKRANINMRDANGDTALHQATSLSNRSMITLLLDNGADIDAQNEKGHTPLAAAILTNNHEMAKYLIEKGADNNVTDAKKRTPIMLAAENGQSDIMKLLKSCKPQNSKESQNEPPVIESKPKNQVQEQKRAFLDSKNPKMEETAQSENKGASERTKHKECLIEAFHYSESDSDSSETSEAPKRPASMMVRKPKLQDQEKKSAFLDSNTPKMVETAQRKRKGGNEKTKHLERKLLLKSYHFSDSDWDSSETSEASKRPASMMVHKPKHQDQEKNSAFLDSKTPKMEETAQSKNKGASEMTKHKESLIEADHFSYSDWDSSETSEASKRPAPMMVHKPKHQDQEKKSAFLDSKTPKMEETAQSKNKGASQMIKHKESRIEADHFSYSDWDSSETSEASKRPASMMVRKPKHQDQEQKSAFLDSKTPKMEETAQSKIKGASEIIKHKESIIEADNVSYSDWDSSETSEASKRPASMMVAKPRHQDQEHKMEETAQRKNKGASEMIKQKENLIEADKVSYSDWDSSDMSEVAKKEVPVNDKMSAQLADTPKHSKNNVTVDPTETDAKMSRSHDCDQVKLQQERIQVEYFEQEVTTNPSSFLLENEVSNLKFQLTEVQKHKQALATQVKELLSEHEATKNCLSLAQSECQLLRDQLQANKKCDCEKRVEQVEEGNNHLLSEATTLKEQVLRLEEEKKDREASLRQLQQELSDAQNNLAKTEASLDKKNVYCKSLEKNIEPENVNLLRKMDRLKRKLAEMQNQSVFLRNCVEEKEMACVIATQRLKEEESSSAASSTKIKHLEEEVQQLRLEMIQQQTAKSQSYKIEVLEKQAQESVVIKRDLEDLVSNLQSKTSLEEKLRVELNQRSQRYQALWEQEVENTSQLGQQLLELEKTNSEQSSFLEIVKAKAITILEQNTQRCQQLEVDISDLRKEQRSLKILLEQSERRNEELRAPMGVTQRGREYDEVSDSQTLQTNFWEAKQFRMEQRISELEKEVVRNQSSEQECLSRLNFTQIELEKYKTKYFEERHKRFWL